MVEWKFLTGQRVRVKRSVEKPLPHDVPELNDIPVRLPPPDDVLGKTGTILTRVQPVWATDVPQGDGDELLHQYEVEVDGVGLMVIIEEWLEPAEE
jgi:hypothetical protein